MHEDEVRAEVLRSAGATADEMRELLAYGANHFRLPDDASLLRLPLEPEPHVEVWREYVEGARRTGAVEELRRRLVQLRFPIGEGVAETEDYRAATRRGESPDGMASATGLVFVEPGSVRILIHESPAGPVPVVVAGAREDFVSLVRAVMRKNAPVPIPDSTGAYMVAGYNNLDRIRRLREAWESDPTSEGPWALQFRRLIPQTHRYQDRFILLAEGPYSGVGPGPLHVDEAEWRRASLLIRMEHECAHYFTRRVLGSMRSVALDEVVADYMGIVAGLERFDPTVLLHVLGVEAGGQFRPGGRLANYLGDPPLSPGAFQGLLTVVRRAAENLAVFDAFLTPGDRSPAGRGRTLLALTSLTLEEMAAPDGADRLTEARRRTGQRVVERD